MRDKAILIGTVLAGLITAQCGLGVINSYYTKPSSINNPAIVQTAVTNSLERKLGANEIKNTNRDYTILNSQKKMKEEEICRIINVCYKELNPPKYITEKLMRDIIKIESDDDIFCVSKAGARGLGQLMNETWDEVNKEDYMKNVFNPEKNIHTLIAYWIWMDKACKIMDPKWNKLINKEKIKILSAAYNGGIGRLERRNWNVKRMPAETRFYIRKLNYVLKD